MIEETYWNSIVSDSDVNKAAEQWSDANITKETEPSLANQEHHAADTEVEYLVSEGKEI